MTQERAGTAGPLAYVPVQAICERLNSVRLPFEPTAETVMLSQPSTPWNLASKVPLSSAVADAYLLSRPLAASRTFSAGWKPVPFTVSGCC